MASLLLLLALISLVYLIYWMIRNDGAQRIEDQSGYIRMAVPKVTADAAHEGHDRPAPKIGPKRPLASGETRTESRNKPGIDPDIDIAGEEEIIHPLWRGRPPKHRP